ncbi:MAG TPA: TAXI family TRAP transporter solute-binding subunit [Candidatus Acidoferrum sp.]|nr:TAXI family TRAP transporter solute-binding subunit [Candidatus Acidoferrum sp.]
MDQRKRFAAAGRLLDRRQILRKAGAAAACLVGGVGALSVRADDETRFFRIGTGPTTGNYFTIGGIIANAISNPPGSRPCDKGGSCGVPGLIAIAQTTQGSVQNVDLIANETLESGLCQSDVAYWAYSGTGMYSGGKPFDGLRAIANLYQESLHIVVRTESAINAIADLRGKRISLGGRGSGTRATAELVLGAYGVGERRFNGQQLTIEKATEALRDGSVDAIFFVGGPPVPALADLAKTTPLRLLPVEGDPASMLRSTYPFLTVDAIPENSYGNNPATVTVGIGTYWLVLAGLDENLVHDITVALWHPATRKLLDQGSPIGRRIRLEQALVGLPLPVHPGAERYYTEPRDQSSPANGGQ